MPKFIIEVRFEVPLWSGDGFKQDVVIQAKDEETAAIQFWQHINEYIALPYYADIQTLVMAPVGHTHMMMCGLRIKSIKSVDLELEKLEKQIEAVKKDRKDLLRRITKKKIEVFGKTCRKSFRDHLWEKWEKDETSQKV